MERALKTIILRKLTQQNKLYIIPLHFQTLFDNKSHAVLLKVKTFPS